MSAMAIEKCYRVQDLVKRWRVSDRTVRRIIRREPGVFEIPSSKARSRKLTLTVPDFVLERIERNMARK